MNQIQIELILSLLTRIALALERLVEHPIMLVKPEEPAETHIVGQPLTFNRDRPEAPSR